MEESCDPTNDRDLIWTKIVGLGERSIRKSYYPQLRQRIAELERAHEELRKSECRYRSLVETTNDCVWEVTADGFFTYVSPRIKDLLGYEPEEVIGKKPFDFMPRAEGERVRSLCREIVESGQPFTGLQHVNLRADGKEVVIETNGVPIVNSRGHVVGYRGIDRDITDRRRAEEALREAHDKLEQRVQERTAELREAYERLEAEMAERKQVEEQLRQAQKMQAIGTLAGGIAHDFNNMLAVIIGNAELARDDVEGIAGPRENIEQILAASKRAKDLVRQILAFSRKTQQRKNRLRLRALIEETLALLRGSLPSTIEIKFDVRTESDCILGDSAQIQQVLINLATNAAHAMREKGGTLTVSLSDIVLTKETTKPDSDMSPGRYMKLTVSDTGVGMRADVLKRIFEPFFTTKEAGQGTGMGLAVAYGIIKSHGGTITAESSPDRGSVFTVFLPQAPVSEGQEKEEREDVPRGRERVLLIDDEPLVLVTASKTLRRLGYDVVTALSGSQALELFFKDPYRFDIVITDQIMPDFTGMDVAARMLERRKDLPVILVTGYGQMISPERATSAGIREFVMKPIEKRELAVTIRRALDARR